MLKEAISEICAEIRLLSQYATSFDTSGAGAVNDDVTMLFSGLCLLSTHAERLMASDKDLVPQHFERDVSAATPGPEAEGEAGEAASGPDTSGEQHGWIVDVVKDLALYARQNDMDQLSAKLDDVLDSVFYEMHFRDLEATLLANGTSHAGNVIAFDAQAAQRSNRVF